MKRRILTDKNRATALLAMAQTTLRRLEDTDQERYPSNTLIDYYDTLHKLMDAIACMEGVSFKGEGAHRQLIDHIASSYLTEKDREFLQSLRGFRNRIQYEGFIVTVAYMSRAAPRLQEIIDRLTTTLS